MGRTKAKQPDPSMQRESGPDSSTDHNGEADLEMIAPTQQEGLPDKLDIILQEIRDTRKALEIQIGTLSTGLNLLRADHGKLNEKVQANKLALQDLIPQQTEHSIKRENIQRTLAELQNRIDEAEGRSRRNNIRILCIPEKCEGRNATTFVEQWLRTNISSEGLTSHFSVERAHRLPSRPPEPGRPPRPLIARILDYRDRDTLLRAARERAPIVFENKTISLYPDFTLAVQKSRATFLEVKRKLRLHNLKYALLFPARLKVIHNQKALFFDTPDEVADWLDITLSPPSTQPTTSRDGEKTPLPQRAPKSIKRARLVPKEKPSAPPRETRLLPAKTRHSLLPPC